MRASHWTDIGPGWDLFALESRPRLHVLTAGMDIRCGDIVAPTGPALVYSTTCGRFTRARMLPHFQRLLDDLPSVREIAAAIASPNPEDDLSIRTAIAGYCYHQAAESWGSDELEFVSRRRSEVADFDPLWIEFVCLASGYLLGLYQAGMLSEGECALFEAQLPGFMWQHSERFTTD